MDISGVSAATVSSLTGSHANSSQAVSVSVLKKALDIQEQSAQQLLQVLPQPQSLADPASPLGQNIDVSA